MYDVIIVGSGIVGATFALLLAENPALTIGVLDKKAGDTALPPRPPQRVSALVPFSKKILQKVNVWDNIDRAYISPFDQICILDEDTELHFASQAIQEVALGYIVEDHALCQSLLARFKDYTNIDYLHPIHLVSLHKKNDYIELHSKDAIYQAQLVVGADGGESWVRKEAAIPIDTQDYQHTALIANVTTEKSHQHTAWQRFLREGPLAFLPLADTHSASIVWSQFPTDAENILRLSDKDFCKTLQHQFGNNLGNITFASPRLHFPLYRRHAKAYVCNRIALIGDAAHSIHPLAGQGVNLGIRDAHTLAETILLAHKKNRAFYALHSLRAYERARKGDILAMLGFIDFIKKIFALENKPIKAGRHQGIKLIEKVPLLKNLIMQYAVGNLRF